MAITETELLEYPLVSTVTSRAVQTWQARTPTIDQGPDFEDFPILKPV